ncbi:hypothetical protein BDN67DRAFT_968027 [Paxillus ammoniavirescens]|nr:hypothetical protein BDN67DRAFT_968027 [Paxillus ammoniavirescens]
MADPVAGYISAVHLAQLTRFCQVSPYVVMLYDHFLTLDQEVEHIWNKPWTSSSILYIILRYPGSAFVFLGKAFVYIQGWPVCVTGWLVQFILQMRLYALYNKSKKLVVFTGAIYLAEIIAMSGILLKIELAVEITNQPLPGIYICTAQKTPSAMYSFWIPPLVLESVLFSLSIWIGVKRSREYLKPAIIKGNGMRLVNVIIMGNVVYFFGVLLSYIVNFAIWKALGPEWVEIPEGFPQAAAIIAGCRLILHVRDASSASSTHNTTKPSDSTQVIVQYPMQRLSHKHILDEA